METRVLERYDVELAELQAAALPVKRELRDEMRRTVAAIRARPRSVENPTPFYGRKNEVRSKAAATRDPLYRRCEQAAAAGALLLYVAVADAVFGPALVSTEAHELAVTAWRASFATVAAVYLMTVSALLTKPEFNQFVPPSDDVDEG